MTMRTITICLSFIGLLSFGWIATPQLTADDAATSDVDQNLLDELDEFDKELEGLPDAGVDNRPDGGNAKSGTPDADTTDEDLLRDLDVGEEIPGETESQVIEEDDLGADVDPVTRIGRKMRTAEQLVKEQTAVARAKTLQDEIAQDLDELIKQLQKQMQQQSSSQSQKQQQKQQQANRTKIQQPSRKPQQKQASQSQSEKPSSDSEERLGQADPKLDLAELTEVIKEIWGHLPEKDRERLRQLSGEKILPNHELPIEKYFRRLAEEDEEL